MSKKQPQAKMGLFKRSGDEKPPKRLSVTGSSDNQAVELSVDDITADPKQPRQQFSEESIVSLADSIEEKGLLQPISVRPNPDQDDKFILVMGERRWRAHRHAKIPTVRAFVILVDDPKEAYELALVENVQRENLNPLEEAEGIANLMRQNNYSQQEAGRKVGRSKSQVSRLLKLNDFPSEVREKVVTSQLSQDHLFRIAEQETPEAMLALHDKILKMGLNVREARQAAKGDKVTKRHPLINKLKGFEKTIIKARQDNEVNLLGDEDRKAVTELLDRISQEVADTVKHMYDAHRI